MRWGLGHIGKAWNHIATDRLHLWGRTDHRSVVPEMTAAELKEKSRRRREPREKQQCKKS